MTTLKFAPALVLGLSLMGTVFAQTDPGPRGGAPAAGGPLGSVTRGECINKPPTNSTTACDIQAFFNEGQTRFEEVDVVVSNAPDAANGLGPRFNSRGCGLCHAQPAVGGTSPATNPQITDATADGARNTIPSFITANGPVREARFPFFFDLDGNPNPNMPNGGVEELFTITGRSDAGSCALAQPSFALAQPTHNIIFRIPTPTFGAGLIENIDEATLLANQAANANSFGIAGTFNHNGNDGTISRFGWKAQNKSLEIFAGEAYNVEQEVINELFTQERPLPGEDMKTGLASVCRVNPTPEDHTNFNTTAIGTLSDTVQFAMFMRLLAPPTPSTTVPGGATSIANGRSLFNSIGCALCHTASLTTTASAFTPSLGNATANLFSD